MRAMETETTNGLKIWQESTVLYTLYRPRRHWSHATEIAEAARMPVTQVRKTLKRLLKSKAVDVQGMMDRKPGNLDTNNYWRLTAQGKARVFGKQWGVAPWEEQAAQEARQAHRRAEDRVAAKAAC